MGAKLKSADNVGRLEMCKFKLVCYWRTSTKKLADTGVNKPRIWADLKCASKS